MRREKKMEWSFRRKENQMKHLKKRIELERYEEESTHEVVPKIQFLHKIRIKMLPRPKGCTNCAMEPK